MSLKRILAGVVVVAFAVVSLNAMAEEKASGAKKAVQELTLTGKLVLKEDIKADVKATDKVGKKEEVTRIKGTETIVSKYVLETADGEVALPEPKAKAGEKAIDMAALVGKNVKVVAKGKVKADGKKHITSIVSIEEEAAPAAAAAPAVAPEAPAPAAPAAPVAQ